MGREGAPDRAPARPAGQARSKKLFGLVHVVRADQSPRVQMDQIGVRVAFIGQRCIQMGLQMPQSVIRIAKLQLNLRDGHIGMPASLQCAASPLPGGGERLVPTFELRQGGGGHCRGLRRRRRLDRAHAQPRRIGPLLQLHVHPQHQQLKRQKARMAVGNGTQSNNNALGRRSVSGLGQNLHDLIGRGALGLIARHCRRQDLHSRRLGANGLHQLSVGMQLPKDFILVTGDQRLVDDGQRLINLPLQQMERHHALPRLCGLGRLLARGAVLSQCLIQLASPLVELRFSQRLLPRLVRQCVKAPQHLEGLFRAAKLIEQLRSHSDRRQIRLRSQTPLTNLKGPVRAPRAAIQACQQEVIGRRVRGLFMSIFEQPDRLLDAILTGQESGGLPPLAVGQIDRVDDRLEMGQGRIEAVLALQDDGQTKRDID